MTVQSLHLNSEYASSFEDFIEQPMQIENLFVITHLGQLKQMEALIDEKSLKSNGLAVLYSTTNFIVPQTVHDKLNVSLFDFIVFIEIPQKINTISFFKLKKIYSTYYLLLKCSQPSFLYLNSFEGHYAVLSAIANRENVKNILVEEGTSTYKFNMVNDSNLLEKLSINDLVLLKFNNTIGSTQLFKSMVKGKKNAKNFLIQTRNFVSEVWLDERIQKMVVNYFGNSILSTAFKSNRDFYRIYASHPDLLDGIFVGKKEYFLGVSHWYNEDLVLANHLVKKYSISNKDVLFLSQRYNIPYNIYVPFIYQILDDFVPKDQRIVIKLHPKENDESLDIFKINAEKFPNRFLILESSRFLVEPLLYLSEIKMVIGLTSSTLIYAPLICNEVRSISIANLLIDKLERDDNFYNERSMTIIKEHLAIVRLFKNVIIL